MHSLVRAPINYTELFLKAGYRWMKGEMDVLGVV